MKDRIRALVAEMTLAEKASLCSGSDFWHTKAIERLGIPAMMMADGPHGLRKQPSGPGEDHLGLLDSLPATCFPSAAGLASSWNRELLMRLGEALGQEASGEGLGLLLGPGVNIKRSPLGGRNFEYFSEDPLLSSTLAAAYIQGVQSQGVGTSLKHFAANNQEHRRMSVDAQVDERALREIYLASFEAAIREGQPWTVMCAYNKLNGHYCSEHGRLLTDILRHEWGFEGFVVSDWGAVNERVDGLAAGLELEMPTSGGVRDRQIVAAVESGRLDAATLDQAVARLLAVILRASEPRPLAANSLHEAHHHLAREIACESMVLLKNEGALPLAGAGSLAIIGEFAERPRFQGGGSSHVNPTRLETPLEAMRALHPTATYAPGFALDSNAVVEETLRQAAANAREAEVAVLFLGLPDRYESEGYDRTHLDLPGNQLALLDAVTAVQPNTVVVLANGSPVAMPWVARVNAVLEGYLGGQAVGSAIADLLFGQANPSGKLAETFPHRLEDTPCHLDFPGTGDVVRYSEGLFVGYRHYDTRGIAPLFPFGHGLSYTEFTYQDLRLSTPRLGEDDGLEVSATLENSGERTGQEVVQLYLHDASGEIVVPEQALKAFAKVRLAPGECRHLTLALKRRDFAYYDVDQADWRVPDGRFEIRVGSSSRDIRLRAWVEVVGDPRPLPPIHRNTLVGDLLPHPRAAQVLQETLAPIADQVPLMAAMQGNGGDDRDEMLSAMGQSNPLRALVSFSNGHFDESDLDDLLHKLSALR